MIGVLGGSFDPIHHGHLRLAIDMKQALGLASVHLVLSRQPPHRKPPIADTRQRLAMVRVAVSGATGLEVDERELLREGPSYTVDTLLSLREEFSADPLVLITGMDAFLGLPEWHEWRRILELAHVAVAHRPGWSLEFSGVLAETLETHQLADVSSLGTRPVGDIVFCPVLQLEISSTEIRSMVAAGKSPRYLLPDSVLELIESNGLYQ